MKRKVRLTESQLNRVVKESVNRVLREHRFMSDEDIAAQYDDMIITYFEIKPLRYGDGWSGTFELEFPNADNIDYESTMVNDFITYDKEGKRISWDKWMPDKQTIQLTKIIRNEIKKKLNNIINEIGDTPKGQYMLGRLHGRSSSVGSKPNKRAWYDSFKKGCEMNGGDWSDDFARGDKDETEKKGTIKEDADDFDNMSYAQLRDELGIYDNDTLNASIETEMEEKLEHEIWNIMKSMANGNPRQNAFDFREFAKIVKDNYGFEYVGGDEDEKCHFFENAKYSMYVSTKGYWYPKQGMMKVDNFGISKRLL